ncbi:rhamnogalacturonan acetylesterase [Caulobacter endophyticus]|uniref:Lysophospholipase n=1 Tax=Caulobacter endophyticus TaxID=2172652 RepID=A0A2T9K3B4_9CAUL|nr:rhamnogalacturonan acetylesterase [Caulobacter endophyticus]PVM90301.1 lysophospholipase [Caulobacter endophyticus]
MNHKTTAMLATLALLATAAPAAALAQPPGPVKEREPRTNAAPIKPYKVILVGDSTTAVGSGWGGAFCDHHVKSSVACLNLGRGGRSTRSYRAEGSWDIALSEARVPGYAAIYVLIQFAHNDQSSKGERWTDLATEFPANLKRFVEDVRAAGAQPVLLTPLTRREFAKGQLKNTLDVWSEEVRKVATETKTPLVDLNTSSARIVQKLGPVDSMKLAQAEPIESEVEAARTGTTLLPRAAEEARLPDVVTTQTGPRGQQVRKFDYTHVGDAGARVFSKLVADDLAAAVPGLRSQLTP